MVTKLRNFSRNGFFKVFAILLVVVCIVFNVVFTLKIISEGGNIEQLDTSDYNESRKYYEDLSSDFYLMELISSHGLSDAEEYLYNMKDFDERCHYWIYSHDGDVYKNTERVDFYDLKETHYMVKHGEYSIDGVAQNITYLQLENVKEMHFAYKNDYLKETEFLWDDMAVDMQQYIVYIIIACGIALLAITYLIMVTGRKANSDKVHTCIFDKIYSDILVAIGGGVVWLIGVFTMGYYDYGVNIINGNGTVAYTLVMYSVILAVGIAIIELIFLTVVRKIKCCQLLKHSLIYILGNFIYQKFIYKIYDLFKSLFDGRIFAKNTLIKALFYKQIVFICASSINVVLFIICVDGRKFLFMLIIFLFELALIYWHVKSNNKTYLDIDKGFDNSLEEQMKSERMKINLVANVSHDLKTPLTSIISYVDLLSKEELTVTSRDYVDILIKKSDRLKHIVADLFELSKATSGDMKLEIEELDIKKLVEQTLADMGDKIEESSLDFRAKVPKYPVMIKADGKKLYRVFQNVIDNALKYSSENTRVFVDVVTNGDKVMITIKNTADNEMNFTAEEILQRFTRGDAARSSAGSGLGLSIAQSFTNACGGDFNVFIDGDLFKVVVEFNIIISAISL